eukprot:2504387-Pyramimonas_sp.AAC.1
MARPYLIGRPRGWSGSGSARCLLRLLLRSPLGKIGQKEVAGLLGARWFPAGGPNGCCPTLVVCWEAMLQAYLRLIDERVRCCAVRVM